MARPRGFSEQKVLDQAMEVFWEEGYEAASIDDVTHATGLSRSSIYQAYGSKRGLLDATLDHYLTGQVGHMLSGLEREGSRLDDIVGFFDYIANVADEYPQRAALGCLLTNTIAEMGKTDRGIRSTGDNYIERLKSAFGQALHAAERAGEIEAGHAEEKAQVLATLTLGTFIRIRGNLDPNEPREIAQAVTALVDSWKAAAHRTSAVPGGSATQTGSKR